jgi:menaquinone-dependent protoporphyrinogen oxidase
MNVLVAYATRHGATAGIAERIADGLRAAGHSAEACPVGDITDLTPYNAFVVGSAAYMFRWLKDATRFAKRHKETLAEHPLWLFSSGPVGTDMVDENGRDIFEATRPKEFDDLSPVLKPKGEKVFFGAYDPDAPPVGFAERFVSLMPASAKDSMPAGDFRDWPAIDAWTAEVAAELQVMG